MAPPTPLAIATQAVNRLVKEEAYYHKEQASQEKRIKKLEEDIKNNSPDLDSNAEYILKQEVRQPLTRHNPWPGCLGDFASRTNPNPQSRKPH